MKVISKILALVLILVSLVSYSTAFAADVEECIPCQANQLEATEWITLVSPEIVATLSYAHQEVLENRRIGKLWCEGQDFESFSWRRLGWHHAATAQAYRDQTTINFANLGITLGWDGDVGVVKNVRTGQELRTVVETRPDRMGILPVYFPQDEFYSFMAGAGLAFPYDAGVNYWTCPYGTTSFTKTLLFLALNSREYIVVNGMSLFVDEIALTYQGGRFYYNNEMVVIQNDLSQVAELVVKYAVENNCEPILSDYFRIQYVENGENKVLHDGTRQSDFLFRTDRVVEDVTTGMIMRELTSRQGYEFDPLPWHQVTYADWYQVR